MSINKVRSFLYGFARILGDVNAVFKGKVGKRIQNRVLGRVNRKIMNKLWRR